MTNRNRRGAGARITATVIAAALSGSAGMARAADDGTPEDAASAERVSEAPESASASSAVLAVAVAGASQQRPQTVGPPSAPIASQQAPGPIDLSVVTSQFLSLPVAGDADSTLRYGGRIDGFFDFGGSVFGLDDSLTLTVRPEYTWGQSTNGLIGLIPANTALFRPDGAGDFDLSLSVTHEWDSGVTLEVGKINLLDLSGTLPIVASNGHYGFQNLGIALPPTAVVPNTLTGAQLEVPTENVIYRAWVFDPDSQYQRTGFETTFDSGVAFLGSATFIQRPGGKPGFYTVAVAGSTRDSFSAELLPTALTPPLDGSFNNESGELALQLSAYQFITLYPEAPGKGWGVLARFQASTGDPTFLDYSGYVGVSGNPRFRPQDRFGIAYFHYSLTDELVDDIAFRLGIEDEQGIEAFYTYGFSERIALTADVQVVDSAVAFRDTGVTLGARLTAGF